MMAEGDEEAHRIEKNTQKEGGGQHSNFVVL